MTPEPDEPAEDLPNPMLVSYVIHATTAFLVDLLRLTAQGMDRFPNVTAEMALNTAADMAEEGAMRWAVAVAEDMARNQGRLH